MTASPLSNRKSFALALALAIAICTMALAPSGARAAWAGNTLDVSATGDDAHNVSAVADTAGNVLVVWSSSNAAANEVIQLRRILADGSLDATTHTLSDASQDAYDPEIAIDSKNRATVVWQRSDGSNSRIQSRRIASSGVPEGTTNTLSPASFEAAEPQLAVDPAGVATVAWLLADGDDFVQARRVDASAVPSVTTHDLSDASADADSLDASVDAQGVATVVWTYNDGSSYIAQGKQIEANGTPDASVTDLSLTGEDATAPVVASTPAGDTFVAWVRSNGGYDVIQERRIPNGAGPDATISDLSAADADSESPAIAANAKAGGATVAWDTDDGSNDIVTARVVKTDGTLPAGVVPLSAAGQDAADASVAVDASGNSLISWERYNGSVDVIQARAIKADGTVDAAAKDLSATSSSREDSFVTYDPLGNATVVWDGNAQARQNIAKPTCSNSNATTEGKQITLTVKCTGLRFTREVALEPAKGKLTDFDAKAGTAKYLPEPGFEGGDTVKIKAVNIGGESVGTVSIGVTDKLFPTVSDFGLTNRRFAPVASKKRKKPKAALAAKKGTTFEYTLNKPAELVRIRIERKANGRKVGKKCRAKTKRNASKRACVRFAKVGTIELDNAKLGKNTNAFSGRLGGRALKPGKYRATIVATDSSFRFSDARSASFTVVSN